MPFLFMGLLKIMDTMDYADILSQSYQFSFIFAT